MLFAFVFLLFFVFLWRLLLNWSVYSDKMNIQSPKSHSSLYVILTAAVLLELISGIQYYYVHNLLDRELEHHTENELTLKAILIKSTLNATEYVVRDHSRDVQRKLATPDSLFAATSLLVTAHPQIVSGAVAFRPYYYPDRGRLFEPWASRSGDSVHVEQFAGDDHDYTTMEFYEQAMAMDSAYWSSPYIDEKGKKGLITTFSYPLRDASGEGIGVVGVDLSLSWLGDTLNNRHKYPSSFVMLLTEDGRFVAGPAREKVAPSTVADVVNCINDSTVARELSTTGRTTVIDYEDTETGRDGHIFYANMRGKPHWQLAVVCYDDEVYASLNRMRLNILLLTLAGLLLLGYILYRSAHNLQRLHQASMEKERLNSELLIAKNIQSEMLPKHYPPFPERKDLDIYGMLEPAKEVGGDLFDFFIRDEKLFFCIGDVSGKGVPSALVMAVTHSLFRSATAHDANPSRIMKALNEASCTGNESNMFVTFFIGVLDLPTGRLRYCNGGHDRPFIINGTDVRDLPANANLPIGLFSDFEYQVQEEQLPPGAMLFLYTDGITEARNPHRGFYGEERLRQSLERLALSNLSAEQLLKSMNESIRDFENGAEQSDDITMLAIRYTPKSERNLLHESLTLTNDISEVDKLGTFMKSLTSRLGMDKGLASSLRLAVEEAVVNVMNYAYPQETTGMVTVEADVQSTAMDDSDENQYLCIKVVDNGVAFDPTETASADTTLSAEERPIGGLGIFLVRELMDTINYERKDGQNILTLRKKIDKR